MKRLKNYILFSLIIVMLFSSCELVDNDIPIPEPAPTRLVRYVVKMTSSSANANPTISYTNAAGGTTQLSSLNLDVTVEVDSGTTATLFGECSGFYSPLTGNSSAAVDLQLFVADSLVADSTAIESDNLTNVKATAQVSFLIN
jgi:hypothetical protein